MLIQETKVVERELAVAPCLDCGSPDIELTDSNYSSFNQGGGKCKKCGRETMSGVGCNPSMDELAAIWNGGNDIPSLVAQEEQKIVAARLRISELRIKLSSLRQLDERERGLLLTVAEYEENEAMLDGCGVWATATHRSERSTREPQPEWATHVLWFNR